ncbi:MAG: HDOD domain-containing protein [Planctomycetota bacterium]
MVDWTQKRQAVLGDTSDQNLLPDIKLPVLPKAVTEFSAKAEDPDCDIRTLAAIVESDTGLTCELLRTVNASANSLSHRISSVRHAIATLGIRRCRMHLITAAVQKSLPARGLKLVNLATYWNANLERAILARKLAGLLKADEDLAFSAGLLVDFLLPTLTNERDSEYLDFLKQQETQPSNLIEFERGLFGWDHAEASARVMFSWAFPDDLICCVLYHHHGLSIMADRELRHSAAAAVALASLMPDPLRQAANGMQHLQKLDEIWKPFDLRKFADVVYAEYVSHARESTSYIPFYEHVRHLPQPELAMA